MSHFRASKRLENRKNLQVEAVHGWR